MVEGPKVILKAERFRCVVSKDLLDFELSSSSSSSHRISSLLLHRCKEVVSVGKELFLVFDRDAIRIHFQMSGSEIILKSGISPPPSIGSSRKLLTAVLKFEEYDIYIFDSNISTRTLESFNFTRSLVSRDISLESFDSGSSVDLLQRDIRCIQETIMDQMIMPGVGNIIKCEGLFRAKVNPNDISRDIPREKLSYLVSKLHSFAREWLLACRRRSKLEYEVYGKSQCRLCNTSIKLVRNAQGDGRITYYCPSCQISHTSPASIVSNCSVKLQCYEGVFDLFVIPRCKCISSNIPSLLQRVRKQGINHNRLFWSCGKKGRNKCGHFAWADTRFPQCLHNQVSTIRRVLKTEGGNNGRYFFCCASQHDHCKYFQWVDRVPYEIPHGNENDNSRQNNNVFNDSLEDRKRTYSNMMSLKSYAASTAGSNENMLSSANASSIGNSGSYHGCSSNNSSSSDNGMAMTVTKDKKAQLFKFKPITASIQIPL